eukprot:6459286-Amphidinium_carterae.1
MDKPSQSRTERNISWSRCKIEVNTLVGSLAACLELTATVPRVRKLMRVTPVSKHMLPVKASIDTTRNMGLSTSPGSSNLELLRVLLPTLEDQIFTGPFSSVR